jgi:hypothetical protein
MKRLGLLLFLCSMGWAQQLSVPIADLGGSGVPAMNCTVGQRYFRTDATAGANIYLCTATNTWTAAGGASAQTESIIFRALCQNTVAGPNFSTPASNPPTFTCVTGANAGDVSAAATAWNYALLSFAENASEATSQSVQGMIPLPSTWSSAAGIAVDLTWRTSATSGDVLWRIQGQCVADAEVPGNFGSVSSFTADTAKGTTLQWNSVPTKTLTTGDVLSGCAAGETFLFRLWRDATQAGDTLAAAADLMAARFTLTR